MSPHALLILALSIVLIMALSIGLFAYWYLVRTQAANFRARLEGVKPNDLHRSKGFSWPPWLLHTLEWLGHSAKPADDHELTELRAKLMGAGYRDQNAVTYFWGVKLLLLGGAPLLFILAPDPPWYAALSTLHQVFVIVVIAALGFYLPNVWLTGRIQQRQASIIEGFPDALDLLVVCVEAGLGLDAAIRRVGEEIQLTHPILSDELQYLSLQLRSGLTRQNALRQLGQRINIEEVRSLVALLIQTDRFGTSVAQALRVHSDSMRKKRFHRAEEIAAKLPAKMMLPLIVFIFPVLFIVILGPAGIQVVENLLPVMTGIGNK